MAKSVTTKIDKLDKRRTIEVEVLAHITRQFKVRVWVALKLIWMASKVLGCGFEYK